MGISRSRRIAPDYAGAHKSAVSDPRRLVCSWTGFEVWNRSSQTKDTQDKKDNDNQANDVDDLIHFILPFG